MLQLAGFWWVTPSSDIRKKIKALFVYIDTNTPEHVLSPFIQPPRVCLTTCYTKSFHFFLLHTK